MSTSTYALPGNLMILDEDYVSEYMPRWLGDYANGGSASREDGAREFTVADAMAASGDYFATLATRLDKLAQGLPQDSSEQIELEHQVQVLFYMQDNYDLIAKYKNIKKAA